MDRHPISLVLLLILALAAPAAGQAVDASGPEPEEGARGRPTLDAHALPPESEVDVDGHLTEEVWDRYPSYRGFVQKEPREGAPARNDTEVWVLYDGEALYVGALLHDELPSSIGRDMARRDSEYGGRADYFEVMIDPNLDRRTGYRFRVTAAGVQTDRYLYEDEREDAAWDAVWESEVAVTDRGWTVEMRIPLSQFRYESSDTARTWGINFGRRRSVDNELTRFALESRLREGRVSQFGYLEGVVTPRAPRRLEVRPYAVATAHRGPHEDGDPFFDGSAFEARAGAEISYGLGSAFTLDATFNPDFGQVEADPAVINLSQFETFFREQRPFFVEDARVFDFDLSGRQNQLFYTRRIGREPQGRAPTGADYEDLPEATTIVGALKLTGRTESGLSVGALAAFTEEEEGRAFFADDLSERRFTVEPRTGYGVFRLQKDFREGQSAVGGIVTAVRRDLPADGSFDWLPASAYSAGVDFHHQWANRRYALNGFVAASHVRGDSLALIRLQRSSSHYFQRPDLEYGSLDSAATSMSGLEWRLQLDERTGNWTWSVWTAQLTPGLEVNDLGFLQSLERLDLGGRIGYRDVTPGERLLSWNASVFAYQNWSHEVLERDVLSWDDWSWARTAGSVTLSGDATLRNYWSVNGRFSYTPEAMSRSATRGGPRMLDPSNWSLNLGMSTDNRRWISFRPGIQLAQGRNGSGDRTQVSLRASVQPSPRVQVSLEPEYTWRDNGDQYVAATSAVPWEPTFGPRYLFADLAQRSFSMETRVDWTFTPELSLQLYAQPLVSSGDYLVYKQLLRPETFDFDAFEEGRPVTDPSGAVVGCEGGRTCEGPDHQRHFDLDGDGTLDHQLRDRDFRVRSLRATAVLRWEYRPGSAVYLVWQRRQSDRLDRGGVEIGRDLGDLLRTPADDRLLLKVDYWLGL